MLKQTKEEETVQAAPNWTSMQSSSVLQAQMASVQLAVDVKDLAHDLRSFKAAVRKEAKRRLGTMDVPGLIKLMAFERQQRKSRQLAAGVMFAFYVLILPIVAFWLHSPAVFMTFWVGFGGIIGAMTFTKAQKYGVLALAKVEDRTAIGELVSALEMRDEAVQQAIRPALTRLLSWLRESDSPLLGERERRVLRLFMEEKLIGQRLKEHHETEEETLLALAVLQALEQVGDASFLPVVTHWAEGEKRGAEPRIRQAAIECLPYLEQTSTRRQEDQELVRASERDTSAEAEALLRPVTATQHVSAKDLLRPAPPEESQD